MKKVAVGVDIGGTNSVYGLVDDQGHILERGRISHAQLSGLGPVYRGTVYRHPEPAQSRRRRGRARGRGYRGPERQLLPGDDRERAQSAVEGTDQRGRKDEALLPHPARHSDQRCERRGRRRNDLRRSERHEGLSGRHAGDRSGQRLRGQRPTDLRIYRIRR